MISRYHRPAADVGVPVGNRQGIDRGRAMPRGRHWCSDTWEAQPVFSRVAIVNRGEAAMRLIHAVRDLSAETGTRIETVALYTDADRTATFVREADVAYPLGPASARPYLDHAVLERALVETRRRRRVGRLGVRRRGPDVRRAVREDRRHVRRAERRGDAQARRQDRLEAARRGGRRPGRAVEPRRGRHPRRTRCAPATRSATR